MSVPDVRASVDWFAGMLPAGQRKKQGTRVPPW